MRRLTFVLVTTLLVMAVAPLPAFALNDTPGAAIALTAEIAVHADRLVGDTGGAVRFYRVDYAGAARPVKIELTASPGRNVTGSGVGFKIYGPDGLIGEAAVERNEDTWTRYSMTLSSVTPGAYLIQVYNYTDRLAVDFDIKASGLAEATQAGTTMPTGSSAGQPMLISQRSANIGGSLTGNSDGSTQYFSFEYPGGEPLTINLQYSPPSPYQNGAVGFNLYAKGTLVGRGVETQRDGAKATVSYTLVSDVGGAYLLQVHNYEPNFVANLALAISGTAGPIEQVTGNTVPEKALELTSAASAVRGSIGPSGGPTFNYFLLRHPDNNAVVTIRITTDSADGLLDGMAGFNLYKGADLAGQAMAYLVGNGSVRVASLSVSQDSAVTYGIQVFNYSTRAPVRYTLYVTGLP